MAKKDVLLIQPHSDDILFSASKFLFNRNKFGDVKVLTIENGNKTRVAEDELLAETFGVTYDNLGFEIEDDSYYHYYKVFNYKVFDSDNCHDVLVDRYGTTFLSEIRSTLRKYVKKHAKRGYQIVVCLGVGHPMHWFIMDCIKDMADLFYRDFPHSYKRKTALEMEKVFTKFILESEYFDEDNHEVKFQASYEIYKTQRSLLFFEKGYIDKKLPEQFYKLR